MEHLDGITERIIGCAIEVHRVLGPGLLESAYEAALCIELANAGLKYETQAAVPIRYKGQLIGDYRLDLLVENEVIVEVKSVERFDPIFQAQVLTYLHGQEDRPPDQLPFTSPQGRHQEVRRLMILLRVLCDLCGFR